MANPPTSLFLHDHQMIVDGVLMQEKIDLTKILNEETGVEESHLTRMKVMTHTEIDEYGDFIKEIFELAVICCTDRPSLEGCVGTVTQPPIKEFLRLHCNKSLHC